MGCYPRTDSRSNHWQHGPLVDGPQRCTRGARNTGDRKNPQGIGRRNSGSHRHLPVLPIRRAPTVRPDREFRTPRQGTVHLPTSAWRLRHHQRLQLPVGGSVLEDDSCHHVRQHLRVEKSTGRTVAVLCSGPNHARSRHPRRRHQPRSREGQRSRSVPRRCRG